ncbi:MAG: DUF4364 family protein [Oscillospiraceae bacterium]|nr:DUF4364 family protein [Oscillospiraceae bacterium]
MDNPGLVRDELDRKILILYVLRRLPAPIDSELLYEVCLCDNGLQYFDYSQSLQDLVDSGNVAEEDDEYVITEKGIRNADAVCTSLPFSVRNAADKLITPAAEMLSRAALIVTEKLEDENGCTMHLAVSDGECPLLDMKIYCGDGDNARQIRRNFRRNAEQYYQDFYATLSEKR